MHKQFITQVHSRLLSPALMDSTIIILYLKEHISKGDPLRSKNRVIRYSTEPS